jgi:hypothetical protein
VDAGSDKVYLLGARGGAKRVRLAAPGAIGGVRSRRPQRGERRIPTDYLVFSNHRDAVAVYHGAIRGVVSRSQSPKGFPRPAQIVVSSLPGTASRGTTRTTWFTTVEFVADDVVGSATMVSYTRAGGTEISKTLSLARFALQHLRIIRSHRA